MIFVIINVVKMVVLKLDYIFVMGNIIKIYIDFNIKGNLWFMFILLIMNDL